MSRSLAVVAVVSLLAGFVAAQEARTGAQPGQLLPGPFRAYVVTGAETKAPTEKVQPEERQNLGDANRVGKFHDFVTRYGLDPTVAVFAREVPTAAQPLGQFLQVLDQAVDKNRAARLNAFAIFLTLKGDYFQDDTWSMQTKQIEGLASQLKLKNVPLAFDKSESERTKAYQIAPENTEVILVSVNQTVLARFAYTADKPLDEAGVRAILAEVTKLVAARP
jgi:hypothetical protein